MATPDGARFGYTPLYALLNHGVAQSHAPLRNEPENHTLLAVDPISHQQNWHSGRSTVTLQSIQSAISSGKYSVLIDLVDCKIAHIQSQIQTKSQSLSSYLAESEASFNGLERIVYDVSTMNPTTPGKLVLVVASELDRTKDSRHVQDKFSATFSYLGDPGIMVLGLVPGETPFLIKQIHVKCSPNFVRANIRMGEETDLFAEKLAIQIKKTLMLAADTNSYHQQWMLWSNFYSAGDVFLLLCKGREAGILTPGFSLQCYGHDDQIEFSMYINPDNLVELKTGEKQHMLIPFFAEAIERYLNNNMVKPNTWDQTSAYLWAAHYAACGYHGYLAYKLMVYASFCEQINAVTDLNKEAVLSSRVLDECYGILNEHCELPMNYAWLETLLITEHKQLILSVLRGDEELEWFGVKVTSETLGEIDFPFFDNDSKGSASEKTLKLFKRVDRIKLSPGHGTSVRSGSDLIRFRIGGQRIQMLISNNELYSSVRFQPHQLLDPLSRLSEIEVMSGKITWSERSDNGYFPVSNAMLNQLLSGVCGRKVGMWVLSRLLYGDLAIKKTDKTVSYVKDARFQNDAKYEIEAPLGANILAAIHTYTDGEAVWVDFKDDGHLLKLARTKGRFCKLVEEDRQGETELHECGIRSTLRIH